jgi:hypothetical protein
MTKSQVETAFEKETRRHELAVREEAKRHKAAVDKEKRRFEAAVATIEKIGIPENFDEDDELDAALAAEEAKGRVRKCTVCSEDTGDDNIGDIPSSWKLCELCYELVCADCQSKCERCAKCYCECVYSSTDVKFCEDCQESTFICCHDEIRKAPCGQNVCRDCVREYHASYDCSDCMDARRGGMCEESKEYWG